MDEKDVQALVDKAVGAATVKFTADIEKVKADGAAAVEAERVKFAKLQADTHRKEVLGKFNAAVEDGRIEPAVRERFEKFAKVADDVRVMEIALADVDAYIKDNTKAGAGAGKQKFQSKATGGADDAPVTGTPASQVDQHAKRHMLSRGEKLNDAVAYDTAVKHVLTTNKELAGQYFDNPNAIEEAA